MRRLRLLIHSRSLTCSVLTLLIATAFRPFPHVFKQGYERRSREENSSPAKSRFPPVLCALAVSGRFSFLLSLRHIRPTEESRRCELPCRGVHILSHSLADNPFIRSLFSLSASNSPARPLALQSRSPRAGRS